MRSTEPSPTLLRAAVELTRALELRVLRALDDRGFPALSSAQLELFRHLDDDGTRVRELAARIGITPQAAGEMARTLAARGWITIGPDPDDQRARRIAPTRQAIEAVQVAAAELAAAEEELSGALGRTRLGPSKRWMVAAAEHLRP